MGLIRAVTITLLLLLTPLTYLASAEDVPTVTITTDWTSTSSLSNEHAYVLTFGDSSSHDYDISVSHLRAGIDLAPSVQTTFLDQTSPLPARIVLATNVAWNDSITVSVTINGHNGVALSTSVNEQRTFTVGSWNQPMADHEVTTTSSWLLEQNYQTDEGNQTFVLLFEGNGWQQRINEVLESYELGNGTLQTTETTDNSTTILDLDFESFWKNETVVSGALTSQVIEARGSGNIILQTNDDGVIQTVPCHG